MPRRRLRTSSPAARSSEHAIATLIGKPPSQLSLTPQCGQDSGTNVPRRSAIDAFCSGEPDIASAERHVAAANQTIGIARAAFFPTISLTGTAGYQGTNIDLLQLPNHYWSIGPGMSLPLFEGGLLRARLRAARAAFEAASGEYRATVLQAFREIEDNLVLLLLDGKGGTAGGCRGQSRAADARYVDESL